MRQIAIAVLCVLAAACAKRGGEAPAPAQSAADATLQQQLLEQLRSAHAGTVIEIPLGTHVLRGALTVQANGVTVRGGGMQRSVLSFKGGSSAQGGIIVQGNGVNIADLSIEDASGDGLVVRDGENITIRNVRATWTGGPRPANGAYGIHVRAERGVLIDHSEAYSAAAAGIYLEQSTNVIVSFCHAEQNVTGITLLDSTGADVRNNVVTGNGVGIVVMNTPGAAQDGHSVRIFGNQVYKNNLASSAAPGNALARAPPGSGLMVNSAREVEIFDNDIAYNQTANILIASHFLRDDAGRAAGGPQQPYARGIYVYGNRFTGGGYAPDEAQLRALRVARFGPNGRLPDIVWDGYRAAPEPVGGVGAALAQPDICIQNENATVLDADGTHGYRNPDTDMTRFNCRLPKLPEAQGPSAVLYR